MKKAIPLYYLNRVEHAIYYFNTEDIQDPEQIESVSLILVAEKDKYSARGFDVRISSNSLQTECLYPLRRCDKNYSLNRDKDYFDIDISEMFTSMMMRVIKNNGIVTPNGSLFVREGELTVKYRDEIISPRSNCFSNSYWEKTFIMSSFRDSASTPWFMTKNSTTISFYVKNLSGNELTINLESSPNTQDVFTDAQRLVVQPDKIAFITPYSLSKYLRLVACSNGQHPVIAKIWFQTQILSTTFI